MKFSILNQSVIIAIWVIHSYGQAQCMTEPVIGESYFLKTLTISLQQEIGLQKPEPNPRFESPEPQSVFGRTTTPKLSFPIHHDLVFFRSQRALRTFLLSSSDFQPPLSLEHAGSSFLLARWEGRYPINKPSKIFPENKRRYHERSAHDHAELIWSPSGFQLNFYRNRYHLSTRCSTPPAVLTETIFLTVHSHQSGLALCPSKNVGAFPLFVILPDNGEAQLAINPNGRGLDAQKSCQFKKLMHATPSKHQRPAPHIGSSATTFSQFTPDLF